MRARAARAGIALVIATVAWCTARPWSKDFRQWTKQDAEQVLADSPWTQSANATFAAAQELDQPAPGPLPGAAQAGMAGPKGYSDGNWDGGVGRMPRGSVPTLPITIRWDSALPVREALAVESGGTEAAGISDLSSAAQKDYVITVLGLVPAGRYRSSGRLETRSQSGTGDSATDPQDPEQMLEGLMGTSKLLPRGQRPIRPEDVKLDGASGALHIFFSRSVPISARDKEVTFAMQFGSMTVQKTFRLKEMMYRGKLEL